MSRRWEEREVVLRSALIAASRNTLLRRIAEDAPPARRVADRFVAGDTLDDAVAAVRRCNGAGMHATLDHLGEAVTDERLARQAAGAYRDALARIEVERLDCSVSVKPTQLGLAIDPTLCRELVAEVCEHAAQVGTHVTLDMEGSDTTQGTVDLVAELRAGGHDNVGCAVQAYLHRTADDVRRLTAAGASLRLCKGAYAEPTEIAYQDREEVDANYVRLAEQLLTSDPFPRLATHDHRIIGRVRNLARRHQVASDRYELQMLYGVREPLQHEIVARGHRLRIYVPYGQQWYPYFVRRLAERPANLIFFLRAVAGRRGGDDVTAPGDHATPSDVPADPGHRGDQT